MEAGVGGTPLHFSNLVNYVIQPTLKEARVKWRGWHAFRRGLATNLYRLGVSSKVIQRILRHANVWTTMNSYIKSVSEDAAAAMHSLKKKYAPVCTHLQERPLSNCNKNRGKVAGAAGIEPTTLGLEVRSSIR